VDVPGQLRVTGLVGGDPRKHAAQVAAIRTLCAMHRHQCGEGLVHATLDRVVKRDLEQLR
jgi:hypothetical protein